MTKQTKGETTSFKLGSLKPQLIDLAKNKKVSLHGYVIALLTKHVERAKKA